MQAPAHAPCGVKHAPHRRLALPQPLGQQLGPPDGQKVGTALVGGRLGQQRLAAAGRAVEQCAAGRRQAIRLQQVAVSQGQVHQLAQRGLGLLQEGGQDRC